MEFLVFRRTDSVLVVVPSMFQPPLSSRQGGTLSFAGVCEVEIGDFTPDVVAALTQDGFACIPGPDWDVIAGIESRLLKAEEAEDA